MHMVWTTHMMWMSWYILWGHIVWDICCGNHEHIPWVTYAVGILCGYHDHMLWTTYAVGIYCGYHDYAVETYTVGDMLWKSQPYVVDDIDI